MPKLLRILFLYLLTGVFLLPATAQIGGDHTYTFLTLSNSARIAGVGGNAMVVMDNDVTLALANPSLISPEMNNNLALSYVNYFTGNNVGFISYAHTFEKVGSFVGSFQFID